MLESYPVIGAFRSYGMSLPYRVYYKYPRFQFGRFSVTRWRNIVVFYKSLETTELSRPRMCDRKPEVLGVFDAERIVAKKICHGKPQFMIKWQALWGLSGSKFSFAILQFDFVTVRCSAFLSFNLAYLLRLQSSLLMGSNMPFYNSALLCRYLITN